ncbi:MAG: diphosphate--fructose-6-phosphate 1-phosphotransferase [Caldilineaceae bacterium]|nr:diphosphate--fructose-6-phosphate 1-phosphotransferase [Caldilineaceae bacterium]
MNILILQCGGPTPVVNGSLAAVIATAQAEAAIAQIWGSRLGWQGLAQGDWVELTRCSDALLAQLQSQPGAALGSGRFLLADAGLPAALQHLQDRQIGAVLPIGGNGTMAAAQKLLTYAATAGYQVAGAPLHVIGVPKTVDNDLVGVDAAPGYASAARMIAQTTRDLGLDLYAMRNFDDVAILEVMGRHAGWLAAASALARHQPTDPPHLILLPEVPFDEAAFLQAVQQIHQQIGICLVIAAEGVRDAAGNFLAEKLGRAERDATGQRMLGLAPGVAPYLATRVRQSLGVRCRQLRPDLMQRSSSALASPVDRQLAHQVGVAAVQYLIQGVSAAMVGLERVAATWQSTCVPFAAVIGQERPLPNPYWAPGSYDVEPAFLAYARPLLAPIASAAIRF